MKTYLLLPFLIFSLLLSCSTDEENNPPSLENLIIGNWKPMREVQVCQNGDEESLTLDSCSQTDILMFLQDGSFSQVTHSLINGECVVEIESSAMWNIENGNLFQNSDGVFEEVEFFELTETTLRLGEFEDDPFDDPCSPEVGTSHIYVEFSKVN